MDEVGQDALSAQGIAQDFVKDTTSTEIKLAAQKILGAVYGGGPPENGVHMAGYDGECIGEREEMDLVKQLFRWIEIG